MNLENEQFSTWLAQLPHYAKRNLAGTDMGQLYVEFKQQQREHRPIKMVLEYSCDYVSEMERRAAWAKNMLKKEQQPQRINFLKHDIQRAGEALESLWLGEHQEQVVNVYRAI